MTLKIYSLILFILLGVTVQVVADDSKDYTKELHQSYVVKSGVKLHVENKYGPVNIDAWDKDEISIDVIIKVKASSQSKADKLFEIIDIQLEGDGNMVRAITSFENSGENSGWWDKLFGSYDEGDYEVTYNIHTPKQTRLDITNKYGHVHINSDFIGDANLTNKYGNIYAEHIAGNVSIDMGYGDIKMGDVEDLTLEIKYSKAQIGDAINVDIDSKYSNIHLDNVDNLKTDTKYDDYEIGSANSFRNSGKYDDFLFGSVRDCSVSSKYTTLKIGKATGSIKLDGGYNELLVKNSTSSLGIVEVEGKYCNVKMRIEHSFSLDFEGEYVTPSLPSDFDSRVYKKDGNELEIEGRRGSGAKTKIVARMDYGSFKILD